jgi:hypothetical protein
MNQLTPAEKAKELFDKMPGTTDYEKKQASLVAVNEIIDAIDWHEFETPTKQLNHWLDVRKELEKKY